MIRVPKIPVRRLAPILVAAITTASVAAISAGPIAPAISQALPIAAVPITAIQEIPFVRALVLNQFGNLPAPSATCTPHGTSHLVSQTYPTGGLEPEFPAWCYAKPVAGAATRLEGTNDWRDTWDNTGQSMQAFVNGAYDYRIHEVFYAPSGSFVWSGFINSDHWMLDLANVSPFGHSLSGGLLVSPDKQFQFESGRFVVEADIAQGADGMGGADHFFEIDITPADHTANREVDSLYGYGAFAGNLTGPRYAAMGVRFEREGMVVAMYDDSGRATDGRCVTLPQSPCPGVQGRPGRVWETQGVGTPRTAASVQGGDMNWLIPNSGGLRVRDVMRLCAPNEHDLHCRDRARVELTRDSIHVLMNGYPVLLIDGLYAQNPFSGADNRIPASWLGTGGVRVYLTSWINGQPRSPQRWHWNEVNVNPHDSNGQPSAPSKSPSFCLGAAPIPNVRPNTCPHQHVPGGPEVPVVGQAGGTAVPTLPPATATAVSATATAVAATATALATQTPQASSTAITATQTPVPATATPVVLPRECTISIAADGSVSGQCQ